MIGRFEENSIVVGDCLDVMAGIRTGTATSSSLTRPTTRARLVGTRTTTGMIG